MTKDTRSPVHGMEYRFSVPLPEEAYKDKIPTVFLPRIHLQKDLIDEISWDMQREMKDAGHEIPNFTGSIDLISGNWTALCLPEAQPDRLPIVTAWDEWAFLYDGKVPMLANDEDLLMMDPV